MNEAEEIARSRAAAEAWSETRNRVPERATVARPEVHDWQIADKPPEDATRFYEGVPFAVGKKLHDKFLRGENR